MNAVRWLRGKRSHRLRDRASNGRGGNVTHRSNVDQGTKALQDCFPEPLVQEQLEIDGKDPGVQLSSLHNSATEHARQHNGNLYNHGTYSETTTNVHLSFMPHRPRIPEELKPRINPLRRPNKSFLGQEDTLEKMDQTLLPRSSCAANMPLRYALYGIGGVGKSEIALQYVERQDDKYWGLFWIDFSSIETAKNAYAAIAAKCGWPASSNDKIVADTVYRLKAEKRPWLLILDNCDSFDIDYSIYLPGGTRGATIITTRQCEVARKYAACTSEITGLDEASAIQLLLNHRQPAADTCPEDHVAAQAIAEQVGFHSLAIIVAASVLRRAVYSLDEYARELTKKTAQSDLLLEHLVQDEPRHGTVFATFEISARQLHSSTTKVSQHAEELLSLLAFLNRSSIPEELFIRAWASGSEQRYNKNLVNLTGSLDDFHIEKLSPRHFEEAMRFTWATADDTTSFRQARALLCDLSLLYFEPTTQVITMHPLIHSWARQRLSATEASASWLSVAAMLSLSCATYWRWGEFTSQLRPHLESCLDMWPGKHSIPALEVCSIFHRFWWQMYRADSKRLTDIVDPLEKRFLTTQDLNRGILNESQIRVLTVKSLTLYRRHEQLGRAESGDIGTRIVDMNQMIVDAWRLSRPPGDRDLLIAQKDLAKSLLKFGSRQEAIGLLQNTIREGQKAFPSDDLSLLTWRHSLARALLESGRAHEAVQISADVTRVLKETQPPAHPELLASQYTLGQVFLAIKQPWQAVLVLEEVFSIQKNALSPTNVDLLRLRHTLGRAYAENGSPDKSILVLEAGLDIPTEFLAATDCGRLSLKHELARSYYECGQLYKAEALQTKIVQMKEHLPRDEQSISEVRLFHYCIKTQQAAKTRGILNDVDMQKLSATCRKILTERKHDLIASETDSRDADMLASVITHLKLKASDAEPSQGAYPTAFQSLNSQLPPR